MISAVCTLFEGHYHYGVGALVNSLYAHGFRGIVYAGYRGELPPWARPIKKRDNGSEFTVAEGLIIYFIPLQTEIHFSNYKPDFMLEVWEKHCPQADALFYFDSDITVQCRWTFFEEWVQAGVALCEDVNPSMAANHPIRKLWKDFLASLNLCVARELNHYFNGGFVGVSANNRDFLICWKNIIHEIGKSGGQGLKKMIVASRSEKFYSPDQDGLNISCMTAQQEISPVGQDGMDFQHGGGGYIMSHAVGGAKPWRKKMIVSTILNAQPPSRADKNFYAFAQKPICLFSLSHFYFKKMDLKIASAIGRYIR